ncbi:phosphoribosyltransferase [Candidatus Bathyarchaeota archaeon A05DMB-2]|nr:phosphoribosyltransferase [Candidatus Bathyarchaeota archaeon A05DMB-2]
MKTEIEYEAPTWNQIHYALLRIAGKIRHSGFKPDVIVGITRGGWVPARVLSDLLEVPRLATVNIEFYTGIAQTEDKPVLKQGVSEDVAGKKVLIVDDIADIGKSLALAKVHVIQRGAAELRTATVYRKPWSEAAPDYYAKETECWVVFPWETRETIMKIAEKHQTKEAVEGGVAKLVKAGVPKRLAERVLKEVLGERGDCCNK